uniref:Chitin-binding type-2 domain-containing protein n=1 Tax=Parasteatoda tepidariorum TaxID=114398 RepID=A0A2L2Y777_PARTP
MLKSRAVSLFLSTAVLAVVIAADSSMSRNKRQAPNHNVHEIPKTSFTCDDKNVGEYYADTEAHCQVYHVCIPGMNNRLSLISFVCPNGTIFSQATKVCTPYERVDCRLTSQFTTHGNGNNRRTNYEADDDYENYVPPPPPRPQPQPARQNTGTRSRNTPAPPPPPPPAPVTQPPRNNRFRSGSNQFRGQQAPTSTTAAPAPAPARVPVRANPPPQPPLPVRGAIAVPARPAPPAFRSPVLAARPPQTAAAAANALPARPTPRTVVSTSTSSYNYEYEYEYDYEDEQPASDQAKPRSKRETQDLTEENASGFTCDDKVPGAAYADLESKCQMFHICILLGKDKVLDYKVHCASGTIFDQQTGACRESAREEIALICNERKP